MYFASTTCTSMILTPVVEPSQVARGSGPTPSCAGAGRGGVRTILRRAAGHALGTCLPQLRPPGIRDFIGAVPGVKVWRRVFIEVHVDDNTQEPAYFRHHMLQHVDMLFCRRLACLYTLRKV